MTDSPAPTARPAPSARTLDANRIVETVNRLAVRIEERFPDSGLGRVGRQLREIARDAAARAEAITQPIVGLRIAVAVLLIALAALLIFTVAGLRQSDEPWTFVTFTQTLDSTLQDVVYVGAAVFFLVTIETRIKRRRALQAIHELRSIAHIIDMHQLTKDPDHTTDARVVVPATASSPERRQLTSVQLARYLDYCSELLSMAGKIAALYVQQFNDPVAVAAVNEVEDLTSGLSRKIWQKIIILNARRESGALAAR